MNPLLLLAERTLPGREGVEVPAIVHPPPGSYLMVECVGILEEVEEASH